MSILEDRAGNLWLGTVGEGLLRFDRERRRFIRYRNHPGNPDSLADDQVTCPARGPRRKHLGRPAGDGSQLLCLPESRCLKDLWQESGNPNSPDSRDGTLVTSIYEDRQGILWIGTSGALNRIDRKTGQYTAYRSAGPAFNTDVTAIVEDGSGTLWVGTFGQGLQRFDRRTGQFQSLRRQSGRCSPLSCGCSVDHTGALWALTLNGLKRLDPAKERLTGYLPRAKRRRERGGPPGSAHCVESGLFQSQKTGRERCGLVATYSGLYRFDPRPVNSRPTTPTPMIPIL